MSQKVASLPFLNLDDWSFALRFELWLVNRKINCLNGLCDHYCPRRRPSFTPM